MKVPRWIVAGLVFGVLWIFVRGPPLRPAEVGGEFILGTAVGVPVAFVFRRLYEREFPLARSVRAIPYGFLYLLFFVRELVLANLDMTYRVLAPRMPIEPQVFLIPLRVQSDLGITTIANSITITPGTLTLDHDPDENALYVHAVYGRDPDAVVRPIRIWENYALEMFDEPLSPADPAPAITIHPSDHPPEPKRDTGHVEGLADLEHGRDGTRKRPDDGGGADGEGDDAR